MRFVRNLKEERKRNMRANKEKKTRPNAVVKEEASKVQNIEPKTQNAEKPAKPARPAKVAEESSKVQSKPDENPKETTQPIVKKSTITEKAPVKETPLQICSPVVEKQDDKGKN